MRSPLLALALVASSLLQSAEPLRGTAPLDAKGDLSTELVSGIDRYLDRVLKAAPERRGRHWKRDLSSPEAYVASIATNRQRLAEILGVVERRDPPRLRMSGPVASDPSTHPALVGTGTGFRVYAVDWDVLRGVKGEGLLLVPETVRADVVAVPDCDWTPEQAVGLVPGVAEADQFPRRLAEAGCRVLVPALVDRSDTFSGLPGVRKIRQSQREVLWRAAYEMGRTIQGYEVQKVLAGVDWLRSSAPTNAPVRPLGVVGWGEGGMIAFQAGALDTRIDLTGVSGFFQNPRLHDEPIYRNVWSITEQFGGPEIAGLVAPRGFVYEVGRHPDATYPPAGKGSDGAAPGRLGGPDPSDADDRARQALEWLQGVPGVDTWKVAQAGSDTVWGDEALGAVMDRLGVTPPSSRSSNLVPVGVGVDAAARQLRQYQGILEDTQWLMRESEFTRQNFWKGVDRKSVDTFVQTRNGLRDYLQNEIVGFLPPASLPANPRSRKVSETDAFTGYEVVLDVHPDVVAYGILLVPKGIPAGERRPVVVCQHGLEGRPSDVADPKLDHPAYHTYGCRLAERGFVVFAPQNAYIGENRFRQVLRKAQPLKLTLWSFIQRQHEVILDWLASQDFVDPSRMAFYGLSYGGKTAVRIPPLIDRYCLSICSADYNEWIWKNVSVRHGYCYLYWGEYDMPEFNLGNTFNYAELSWFMIPRPFMVERGHDDGVAPDEWVAYEFAKTRRQYVKLGIGDRTEIEFFDGPHTIHGKGTFDFLQRHLKWPR